VRDCTSLPYESMNLGGAKRCRWSMRCRGRYSEHGQGARLADRLGTLLRFDAACMAD
jgi:hypothetical protein